MSDDDQKSFRRLTPEAWLAECYQQEIHDLTIMCRSLEFDIGFAEGRQAERWEGAHEGTDTSGIYVSVAREDGAVKPGQDLGAADPGTRNRPGGGRHGCSIPQRVRRGSKGWTEAVK